MTIGNETEPMSEQENEARVTRLVESVQGTLDNNGDAIADFREAIEAVAEETGADILDVAAALAFKTEQRPPAGRPSRGRDEDDTRPPRTPEEGMEIYQIGVGYQDGVKPGHIVATLANETGIEGRRIGNIDIREEASFVELPAGMPEDVLDDLQEAEIRYKPMRIKKYEGETSEEDVRPQRRGGGGGGGRGGFSGGRGGGGGRDGGGGGR
ncbi:MAG: ATP-dependent RNA helicase DeaD, partial [Planctomycetota bacterium]